MDDVKSPGRFVSVEHLDISTKHFALSDKHLSNALDDMTLILKTHLLLEELLRDFCESSLSHPKYLREARLTFKQILNLARSINTLNAPRLEWTWGAVGNVNTMRNLMAHALEPDERKFASSKEAVIKAVMSHTSSETPTFQGALSYLYGVLGGLLQASLILKAGGTTDHVRKKDVKSAAIKNQSNTDF